MPPPLISLLTATAPVPEETRLDRIRVLWGVLVVMLQSDIYIAEHRNAMISAITKELET